MSHFFLWSIILTKKLSAEGKLWLKTLARMSSRINNIIPSPFLLRSNLDGARKPSIKNLPSGKLSSSFDADASRAWRVCVLTCLRTWRAWVLTCLAYLRAFVLPCLAGLRVTCLHAYVLGVLGVLTCLACLHAWCACGRAWLLWWNV